MTKKAIIAITLCPESSDVTNDKLANEIFNELDENRTIIPWCKKVNVVSVQGTQKMG